jgi:CheY-like chemotaxis protein
MKNKQTLPSIDNKGLDQNFFDRALMPPGLGAPDPATIMNPGEGAEAFLRTKKVLIVENNLMNLYIAKTHLSAWGMEVTMVENGQQAVEAYQKNRHDVVLMDLQMPGMNGIDTAKIIKSLVTKDEVPIIAVTAHAVEDEKKRCIDAGMSSYIAKPYRSQDLKMALITALGNNFSPTTGLKEEHSNGNDSEPLQVAANTDTQWTIDLINIYFTISMPLVREMNECCEKFDTAGFRAVLYKFLKSVKRLDIPPFSRIIERFLDDTTKVRTKQDLKDLTSQIESYVIESHKELKGYLDQLDSKNFM